MQKDEMAAITERTKDLHEMNLKEIIQKAEDAAHDVRNSMSVLGYCLEIMRQKLKED